MPIQLQRRRPDNELILPDSLHPLLRHVYRRRPLASAEELALDLSSLLPPATLKGMDAAVQLLENALEQDQRILIVSDFDADGATSCVVAMEALRQCGAGHVDYIVPNRFEYGYGLTPEIVELARSREPALLITVDNGISSLAGVEAARAAGMRVLITDHHLAGAELPRADAIVNPNQPGCDFASKCIAGVGVIFYVMLALRARLRERDWFAGRGLPEPHMADLLDLVALGTVADVVALDRNNRILVREGLRRIRAGRTRPGILALLEVAGRKAATLTASDLGFSLGPRLNAAGRLDDMSTGIECLLASRAAQAHALALQLDAMNQDRKQIESHMRDQALASLRELTLDKQALPPALCLFDDRWHQGVVGILASRIKDSTHRPVIAFAPASDEADCKELKGSARSIRGFHIRDALDAVATRHPGLISRFGGHAMAAGLSLERERFEAFRDAFIAEAERQLDSSQLQAMVLSDGEVNAEHLTLETARALEDGGPWGQAFPEPVFDGRFAIVSRRRVGERHLKMVLSPPGAPQQTLDAIAFNVADDDWPADEAREITIVYRLESNEFRGRLSVQLLVEHILRCD